MFKDIIMMSIATSNYSHYAWAIAMSKVLQVLSFAIIVFSYCSDPRLDQHFNSFFMAG